MQPEKQIIHKIHYKPPFKTKIPTGVPHITPPLSLGIERYFLNQFNEKKL